MTKRRRYHRSDGQMPFLLREFGGAPWWFIIAAVSAIAIIGLYVLVKAL